MKIVGSREFNQDVSSAKRFARAEPVFVTDRGKPTHVLLSIDAFRQLTGHTETMVDLLAMPDAVEMDLDAARSGSIWDRVPEHR
ncbi:MAG: type II toxin-antitoxin system Phd/YefM family antitoxin [Pseudomonadota bacterium]